MNMTGFPVPISKIYCDTCIVAFTLVIYSVVALLKMMSIGGQPESA